MSRDEIAVEMPRADPTFPQEHLATALEVANLPSVQFALVAALHHAAEAQGMANVAE
jgi:DNA-binding phage protein